MPAAHGGAPGACFAHVLLPSCRFPGAGAVAKKPGHASARRPVTPCQLDLATTPRPFPQHPLDPSCPVPTQVIDGELEEEEGGECEVSAPAAGCRLSLTQPFPFEGCPPTTRAPATSPGLRRLVEAVGGKVGVMSPVERNSIIKASQGGAGKGGGLSSGTCRECAVLQCGLRRQQPRAACHGSAFHLMLAPV